MAETLEMTPEIIAAQAARIELIQRLSETVLTGHLPHVDISGGMTGPYVLVVRVEDDVSELRLERSFNQIPVVVKTPQGIVPPLQP